jgi:hypothetical protein
LSACARVAPSDPERWVNVSMPVFVLRQVVVDKTVEFFHILAYLYRA